MPKKKKKKNWMGTNKIIERKLLSIYPNVDSIPYNNNS